MNRTTAVRRIDDVLGFRITGHSLTDTIVLRLQEAQRDLEKGKTLPKFLLQEDQPLSLVAGTHTVALPAGFLRDDDDRPISFFPVGSEFPFFLARRSYKDAVVANLKLENDPTSPSVYVLRNTTIDFIVEADITYALTWNYYKAAEVLTTDIENEWLAHAPEWLIGEAGLRLATDLRDAGGVQNFTAIRAAGRAAIFADQIALEESGGPYRMGANL